MIDTIKKRDGRIVRFDREKIERAITKAYIATSTEINTDLITHITDSVISDLSKHQDRTPEVEEIQDLVERQIASSGLFEVAKAYILYRHEHEKIRVEEKLEKIETRQLQVVSRDGSSSPFSPSIVRNFLKKITHERLSATEILEIIHEITNGVYDGISSKEITRIIIMSFIARVERDPIYSKIAADILLNAMYKDVIGVDEFDKNFEKKYRESLESQMKLGVSIQRLDPRLLEYDYAMLSKAMVLNRDHIFNYMGIETLYERYFTHDFEQHVIELPQHYYMRLAMGFALNEKDKNSCCLDFYNLLSTLRYVPSTPTQFHAGTLHPQMSSCYLTTVEDDLAHIFKCIGDNAQLSKWSGGLGNDWTNIRGTGALIKGTNVGSQGVIPFLKIDDATTAAINRSGKRRGAACVYLETWHYDIEEFIELRKNTGDERRRIHDTDTANWIPDLFMKRVLENGDWTLFSPDETPELHHVYGKQFEKIYTSYEKKAEEGKIQLYKKISAQYLWRKMISMLFETGHPWITFKDPCNLRSPQDHVGVVHSSNLCTEITLNTSADETAVCNLGSINLPVHMGKNGKINKKMLSQTISFAMRMLDNIIDYNFYPTIEAEHANYRHRPVGLGIMGLQDIFFVMGMRFDSNKAVEFSDELMEFVSYHAILSSSRLAKEKGQYQSYPGSKWDRGIFPIDTLAILEKERGMKTGISKTGKMDWTPVREHVKKYGMRNSNCMAIAPTATISTIAGTYPSIEPIYENLYVKSNQTGEFTIMNEYLVKDLKKLRLWNEAIRTKLKYFDGSLQKIPEIPQNLKDMYKEAFEIDPLWVIKHAAYRGKWIDQSQSINIFSSTVSGKEISDIYMAAWQMGLKTTYYLRSLGASRIEKSTIDINKKYENEEEIIVEEIKACRIDDPECEACQ